MAEAKHSFVDDNPYLVYSPNAETTSESGSGDNIPIFKVTTDNGALSEKASDLITMCNNGFVYIVYGSNIEDGFNYGLLVSAYEGEGSYHFVCVGFEPLDNAIYHEKYTAATGNDYPAQVIG